MSGREESRKLWEVGKSHGCHDCIFNSYMPGYLESVYTFCRLAGAKSITVRDGGDAHFGYEVQWDLANPHNEKESLWVYARYKYAICPYYVEDTPWLTPATEADRYERLLVLLVLCDAAKIPVYFATKRKRPVDPNWDIKRIV